MRRGITPILKLDYINEKSSSDWWLKADLEGEIDTISSEELRKLDPILEYAI